MRKTVQIHHQTHFALEAEQRTMQNEGRAGSGTLTGVIQSLIDDRMIVRGQVPIDLHCTEGETDAAIEDLRAALGDPEAELVALTHAIGQARLHQQQAQRLLEYADLVAASAIRDRGRNDGAGEAASGETS